MELVLFIPMLAARPCDSPAPGAGPSPELLPRTGNWLLCMPETPAGIHSRVGPLVGACPSLSDT